MDFYYSLILYIFLLLLNVMYNNIRWETKLWTVFFFMGTCTLYASRVALPICATAMAQEYSWSKTDSV